MKVTVIILFFILIIVSNLYSQGISYNQEFQVNSNTKQCEFPSVAQLENGGFVICWASCSPGDGSESGIYGQIFNNDGFKVGTEFQVNTYISGDQLTPFVLGLKNGGFIVAWISEHIWWRLCGQIFNDLGGKIGDEFIVSGNVIQHGNENNISIARLWDGGFIICWLDWYNDWGQFFDDSGNIKGIPFKINTSIGSNPTVAGLNDSGFVVCWESGAFPFERLLGQMFDASGEKKGIEFQVNTYQLNSPIYPVVAGLKDGGFVVCWQSYKQDGSYWGIYGKLYNSSGTSIGEEFQINTYTDDEQNSSSIAALREGGFIACWQSWNNVTKLLDINGQLFDRSGRKIGIEFQINMNNYESAKNPSVVSLKNSGYVVAWSYRGKSYNSGQISGRFLLSEPIFHQLHEFSLLEPLNDATQNTTNITFLWHQPSAIIQCYPWELTFDLCIDTDINFANPKIIKNLQDTTYTIDSLAAGKTYFWKVLAKNLAGDSLWSKQQDWGFFIKQGATSVETAEQNLPNGFELFQNYPNPFNSITEIKYSLAAGKTNYQVQLNIYDTLGRLIKVLVDQSQSGGTYVLNWNATNWNNHSVASGLYFYVLQVGDYRVTKKMLVLQ